MWAMTSSSAMWPIGLKSAIAIISRPEPKQSWRQSGTGRPRPERVARGASRGPPAT